MENYIFKQWKDVMDNFQKSVQKELEEIHQQKSAVQQMKSEIFKRLDGGKFYRDENRIVISAPQIVIGNVDYSGDLLGSMGEVIVKGSNVALEGVGSTGSITSRAPSIRQIAVNPGSDGQENVVEDLSEIVSQACDIVLQSDDAHGVFAESPASAGQGGVRIHASSHMQIEAAVSSKKRKEEIEASVKALTSQISDMEKSMANQKKQVDGYFSYMEDLLKQNEKLNTDDLFTSSANTLELNKVSDQIEKTLPLLYQTSVDFIKTISALAEANRKKKALEKEKGAIKEGDDFKKNTTDADMTIAAEHINIATIDGDGNLHANPEAGISMRTPGLAISMLGDDGTTVENSSFSVLTENVAISTLKPSDKGKKQTATGSVKISSKDVSIAAIDFETEGEGKPFVEKQLTADGKVSITAKTVEVSTANPTNIKVDDKGKKTGGEYKAEGDVIIKSKTLTMESLDYEVKDGKLEKKALTKDSKLAIRTEKMDFMAADTEGKATGSISMNAKAVSMKSMDVDKEKLTDTALAAGSTMTLVSEKMYVGSKSKDIKSKKLQAQSEEMGLFADKTFEAQQGDGKAVVQLDGGNASVGGSKTQLYGDTTINAKAEVKGDLKAPKAVIDNLEAKSSLKSPNISDGMAMPGGGAGGSLSAKLKTEDAPKE